MIVGKIIDAVNSGATFTDIRAIPNTPVSLKTPTGWEPMDTEIVPLEEIMKFGVEMVGIQPTETETAEAVFWRRLMENNGSLDVAKSMSGIARLRCNFSFCGDGESTGVVTTIRKLAVTPPDIRDIGIPESMVPIITRGKGLWLVTGPTGNGKSTTIAAMLEYVNRNEPKHILTIEQPIEYVLAPKKSIVTQREVGSHMTTFAAGLHAALRQRPDIIMIGEVRDQETLETMVSAAESGHLVMSTIHSQNVEEALVKISGYFGENKQKLMSLALNLGGIISQALVPSLDKKSLVLVYEIFVNSPEAQQTIRTGEFQKIKNAIAGGRNNGCCLMNDVLKDLVAKKRISLETARNIAYDKNGLSAF